MSPEWLQGLPASHRRLVHPIRPQWWPPMLPDRSGPPAGDWLFERKFDGYRILAVAEDGPPSLYSRSGRDVTARYPALAADLPSGGYVLDGEAVAFHEGKEDFGAVQLGRATHLVLFDVLVLDGLDVRELPLRQRRRLLAQMGLGPRCARAPATNGDAKTMRERACADGWEGLVAKRADSRYRSGRSPAWRKLKCVQGQEFVIGGHTPGVRHGFGALLVGHYQDGRLTYAGKVGTGFDAEAVALLRARMDGLERSDPPFVDPPAQDAVWVEPRLVCRVDFTEWTSDGRLRHPRYLGLRDDKPPQEVVRET